MEGLSASVAMAGHAGHRHNSLEDLFSFNRAFPAGVTLLATKASICVSAPFFADKVSQYAFGKANGESNIEGRRVLCQQLA